MNEAIDITEIYDVCESCDSEVDGLDYCEDCHLNLCWSCFEKPCEDHPRLEVKKASGK